MEPDIVGHTRDGTRFELTFTADGPAISIPRLRDVIKIIEAHIRVLEPEERPG